MSRTGPPLFTVDGRGSITTWSARAADLFGRPEAEAVGCGVLDLVTGPVGHPAPSGRSWRAARIPGGTGEPRWAVWEEGPDDGGRLDEAVLAAVFDQADVGVHVLDTDLRVLRVNHAAIGMRGVPEECVVGKTAAEAYEPTGITLDELGLRAVLATGRPMRDRLVRGRPRADPDRERTYSVSVYRLQDDAGEPLGLVATAVDVTDRERAEERLHLLHEARERIGRTLDVEHTAREFVEVAVPAFADSVLVALTDSLLQGSAPRPRPDGEPLLLRCTVTGCEDTDLLPPVGSVLLPGLFGDPVPARPVLLEGGCGPSGPEDDVRLVAPLRTHGQLLGAVVFRRAPGSEPFTPEDLDLAEGLTARTATCLENALRYSREHIVMTALQSHPPGPERETQRAAEIVQRHHSGGSGAGSWFDSIPLPGARVALVVGRVEHPGLSAVATMSRLRTAVHSLTTLDLDPHELLARLHSVTLRLAREQGEEQGLDEPTASCTFAVYDPGNGRLDLARAGTSLCAVALADGSLEPALLDEGALLGGEGPPFASGAVTLPEGSTICLASSGEDEATVPTAGLAAALERPSRDLNRMADDLQRLLAPDRVLLLARTRRLPASDVARWDVPRDLAAVAPARRRAAERVAAWALPLDPYTVELVVSELVTNAVRYGAEPLTLRLLRGTTTLTAEVHDRASSAPYLRHAKAADEGGRGLHICATLAENWGVRHTEDGKTVWVELAL
ncbi:SpoIIE family protein phosphatase [Streptomyces sp. NPDC003327]